MKICRVWILYEPDLLQKADANYFLKLWCIAREICKFCMFDFDEMDWKKSTICMKWL